MALKLSKNSSLTDIVTDQNPIVTQHPVEGSESIVQLWLFNDNVNKRYESINIQPIDILGSDESGWITLSSNGSTYQPAGATLTMNDINDTTGKPIWVKVTTPLVDDTQNKNDIKLQVNFTEFAV